MKLGRGSDADLDSLRSGTLSEVGNIVINGVMGSIGNILHVRGTTAPGATLTLNGLRIDVQADGSFNEFVMFEAGAAATVAVRSTAVNGAVTEQQRPVVVSN